MTRFRKDDFNEETTAEMLQRIDSEQHPRRGGNQPLTTIEDVVAFHMVMPRSLREKIKRLGGSAWVREKAELADIEIENPSVFTGSGYLDPDELKKGY